MYLYVSVCDRMLLVCYSYVSVCYSYVFVCSYVLLSYDPYGPASAFFAKPLMKVPYEGRAHLRERGQKKSALLQKLTTLRVPTSSKFVSKLVI